MSLFLLLLPADVRLWYILYIMYYNLVRTGTMREPADMKSYTKQKTETDRKERRSFLKKYLLIFSYFML